MQELVNKITFYAQRYYQGYPEVSDKEFDDLVAELKEKDPNHPILSTVGWGYFPEPGKQKSEHLVGPVGSLDKIKFDEIDEYKPEWKCGIISPKLDGGSFVAYYINGNLNQILTRGNGSIGVDVTKNMYHTVPKHIETNKGMVAVRGEGVITLEDFNDPIFSEMSHPRNAAVGLSQSLEPDYEKLKYVRFVAYSIMGATNFEEDEVYKINQINILDKWNFETVPCVSIESNELAAVVKEDKTEKLLKISMKDGKTFPIDGLVISSNQGFTVENERGYFTIENPSIAYKFEDETEITTVTNIEWNLSRTGRMVPLLHVDPVNLEGATITKVTANNYEWLKERRAGIRSTIIISRANQVVPKLVQVIWPMDKLNEPEQCPECGTKLKKIGVDLVCPNDLCDGKMKGIIQKIWEFIKPDGASNATFDLMISTKFDKNLPLIEGFYKFLNDRIIAESDNHYELLMCEAAQNYQRMQVTIADVISHANIPAIGKRIGTRIEGDVKTLENFEKFLFSKFPGNVFKHEVLNENLDYLQKSYMIWKGKIMETTEYAPKIRVAVTGALSVPREQWYKQMELYGVTKSGITKSTSYLVCNNPNNSSKLRKAKEYGIPIVSEQEIIEILSN